MKKQSKSEQNEIKKSPQKQNPKPMESSLCWPTTTFDFPFLGRHLPQTDPWLEVGPCVLFPLPLFSAWICLV